MYNNMLFTFFKFVHCVNIDIIYFEAKQFNQRNGLIYILTHIEIKSNKIFIMLFNSGD